MGRHLSGHDAGLLFDMPLAILVSRHLGDRTKRTGKLVVQDQFKLRWQGVDEPREPSVKLLHQGVTTKHTLVS